MTVQTPVTEYPRSQIPLKPVLSWGTFGRSFRATIPSVMGAGQALPITSGRVGIALALKQCGIGAGDNVLIPAYHCTSMVEPVVWTGATPIFYRIHADTRVDLDDFENKCNVNTRAALVTHYFGFPQDMAALRQACDRHRVAMIEDCAHAFFGEWNNQPLGTAGDYAIASAMKFFAIHDGGCLVSARRPLHDIKLESAGVAFELKTAINTLEQAFSYSRLTPLNWIAWPFLWLKDWLWRRVKKTAKTSTPSGPGASEGDYEFEPRWLNTRMSIASRVLIRLTNQNRLVNRRRQNYKKLHMALASAPGVTPLFPDLPEKVVPYVYPLLMDEPERVFPILKMAGVPILRFGEYLWPDVDEGTCAVAADLSRRLFQFPCHQELREHEIDWMIARIVATLSKIT